MNKELSFFKSIKQRIFGKKRQLKNQGTNQGTVRLLKNKELQPQPNHKASL